jgi:hypothetical protein
VNSIGISGQFTVANDSGLHSTNGFVVSTSTWRSTLVSTLSSRLSGTSTIWRDRKRRLAQSARALAELKS